MPKKKLPLDLKLATMSESAPEKGSLLRDPRLYINRELSWIEFNRRVLQEAQNQDAPLLERIKKSRAKPGVSHILRRRATDAWA